MAKRTTTKRDARHANVFGADPHRRTITATVLDERGGLLGTETFRVSGDGHREMERWALQFGPIARWGIEGASGIGRHSERTAAGRVLGARDATRPIAPGEIRRMVDAVEDKIRLLADADPKTKAALYASLGVSLGYEHDRRVVTVEARQPGHVHNERVGGLFGTPNTRPAPLRRWCTVGKPAAR